MSCIRLGQPVIAAAASSTVGRIGITRSMPITPEDAEDLLAGGRDGQVLGVLLLLGVLGLAGEQQGADAAGVDELALGQVDHDPIGAGGDGVAELAPQLVLMRHVDLAR